MLCLPPLSPPSSSIVFGSPQPHSKVTSHHQQLPLPIPCQTLDPSDFHGKQVAAISVISARQSHLPPHLCNQEWEGPVPFPVLTSSSSTGILALEAFSALGMYQKSLPTLTMNMEGNIHRLSHVNWRSQCSKLIGEMKEELIKLALPSSTSLNCWK